jgi:hypothetical protein
VGKAKASVPYTGQNNLMCLIFHDNKYRDDAITDR